MFNQKEQTTTSDRNDIPITDPATVRAQKCFNQPNTMKPEEGNTGVEKIPDWIIKYHNQNYQSSAGKAIRFLMKMVEAQDKALNFISTEIDHAYSLSNEDEVRIKSAIQRAKSKINGQQDKDRGG